METITEYEGQFNRNPQRRSADWKSALRSETVGYGQGMSFENGARSCKVQVVRFVSCFWLFWGFLGLFFSTTSLPAANVLISPGFEANPAGTNQPIYGWQSYGNNVYSLNG